MPPSNLFYCAEALCCKQELLFTAAIAAAAGVVQVAFPRREKLVFRELDFLEEVAGVLGVFAAAALLLRHAEIVYRNQHLHIARQLNDREYSKCYQNFFLAVYIAEVSFEAFAYALRYAAAGFAAAIASVSYTHLARVFDAGGKLAV